MSSKLGYTWYPKDFISDPDVMFMTSSERGVYRDLIDLAYMSDNRISYSVEMLAKYTNSDAETVQRILDKKGKKKGDNWTIPSCEKRIELANKNRTNGSKGGRPKTETKPKNNPEVSNSVNPNETQTQRQREREREREREKEIEREGEEETREPVDPETDFSNSNHPKPNSWGDYSSMDDIENVLLSQRNWQSEFGKSLGIGNPEDVPLWINKFFSFCKGQGKVHKKESEAKSHCHSWTRRQIELGKTVETAVTAQSPAVSNDGPPAKEGSDSELVGKWIWLNNGWRDTTVFTDHQKRKHGLR